MSHALPLSMGFRPRVWLVPIHFHEKFIMLKWSLALIFDFTFADINTQKLAWTPQKLSVHILPDSNMLCTYLVHSLFHRTPTVLVTVHHPTPLETPFWGPTMGHLPVWG